MKKEPPEDPKTIPPAAGSRSEGRSPPRDSIVSEGPGWRRSSVEPPERVEKPVAGAPRAPTPSMRRRAKKARPPGRGIDAFDFGVEEEGAESSASPPARKPKGRQAT